MTDPLVRMQRGLEELYRVETGVSVEDYVVGAALRDAVVSTRHAREQLLVHEDGEEMALALFIDPQVISNLVANDPGRALGDHNLGDFLLAIEGVSHFIYAVRCAREERKVSQLELELQAEIDKYVTCLLMTTVEQPTSSAIRQRLFVEPCYEDDLDHEEHSRYRAANDNALRYSAYLEQQFVARRRIPEMLAELRRFYREGLAAKLSMIARAA